jgi:hypothetical protein
LWSLTSDVLLSAQDDRPVFQTFKSLLIGPHVYAGLTHGPRIIIADPTKVASMVTPLTSEGTLSPTAAVAKRTTHTKLRSSGGEQLSPRIPLLTILSLARLH